MDLIERAAHALRIADSADFFDAESKDYPAMVRAVLEAIREPSEKMNAAGQALGEYPWDGKRPSRIFAAMIDAALTETGKQG